MDKMDKQVMIRMNSELLNKLKEDAEKNGRTVAQSVSYYLKQIMGVK